MGTGSALSGIQILCTILFRTDMVYSVDTGTGYGLVTTQAGCQDNYRDECGVISSSSLFPSKTLGIRESLFRGKISPFQAPFHNEGIPAIGQYCDAAPHSRFPGFWSGLTHQEPPLLSSHWLVRYHDRASGHNPCRGDTWSLML